MELKKDYILELKLKTDGDFYIPLIPSDMHYDGEDYFLSVGFNSVDKAHTYVRDLLIPSFKTIKEENFRGTLVYGLEEFMRRISTSFKTTTNFDHYISTCLISGNQEGEITLTEKRRPLNLSLSFTEDEYELFMKAEEKGLYISDIKEVFLKLCEEIVNKKGN